MADEILLDVSSLPPPEPLELILDHLGNLPEGAYLRVLHRREPWPLFSILDERGFRYRMRPRPHAGFEILIWRADDTAAERALEPDGR